MKKMFALVLVIVTLFSTVAVAETFGSVVFDNKNLYFVACGFNEEQHDPFSALVDYDTFIELIKDNNLMSAYVVVEDGVTDVNWTIDDETGEIYIACGRWEKGHFIEYYNVFELLD